MNNFIESLESAISDEDAHETDDMPAEVRSRILAVLPPAGR